MSSTAGNKRVKFDARASDRRLRWYAVGTALAAYILFFGIFSYRAPERRSDDRDSAVEMLPLKELSEEDREWFVRWLDYHDPRNSDLGVFDDAMIGGVLHDLRPKWLTGRPEAVVTAPAPELGGFGEVPRSASAERVILPAPVAGPAAAPAAKSPPPPVVTDGEGRPLAVGELKLPRRTPRTVGRTVLRVFKAGGSPALLVERSCGDAALDGAAVRSLLSLARAKRPPEFIVVEWPEAEK